MKASRIAKKKKLIRKEESCNQILKSDVTKDISVDSATRLKERLNNWALESFNLFEYTKRLPTTKTNLTYIRNNGKDLDLCFCE